MAEEKEPKKKTVSISLEKEGASIDEATDVLASIGEALSKATDQGWEVTGYSVNNW